MKKIQIIAIILFCSLFLSIGQASAAFTVSVSGLDSLDIHGFTFWLDVSDDFTFSNVQLGDAIPDAIGMGWVPDTPQVVPLNPTHPQIFKYGASDWDYVMSMNPNPLKDGTLFTMDYTGTINGFELVQFADINAQNLYGTDIVLASFNADGANFVAPSAVPIPGAVWLLGSGLIGLVALGRKKRQ